MTSDSDTGEKESLAVVGSPLAHDSALKHVTGEAVYVDDIREPNGTLHVVPGGDTCVSWFATTHPSDYHIFGSGMEGQLEAAPAHHLHEPSSDLVIAEAAVEHGQLQSVTGWTVSFIMAAEENRVARMEKCVKAYPTLVLWPGQGPTSELPRR